MSFYGAIDASGQGPPRYRGFTITLRRTTLDRTHLDEWSAWRRDLYLTTHNTHRRLDTHADGGIRTRDSSKREATDPTLTARSLAWAYLWSSEINWTVLCLLLNTAQFKKGGGVEHFALTTHIFPLRAFLISFSLNSPTYVSTSLPTTSVYVKVKVKLKFTLEQATKTQSESRGMALLFL